VPPPGGALARTDRPGEVSVARGFESKSVADAQEAMQAEKPVRADALAPEQKRLQLARADVEQRLRTATSGPHREMLRRALAALDEQSAKK
jgi:hypothetical protein